jgi:hypothetical protein
MFPESGGVSEDSGPLPASLERIKDLIRGNLFFDMKLWFGIAGDLPPDSPPTVLFRALNTF